MFAFCENRTHDPGDLQERVLAITLEGISYY